jgi:serine/threonine kinase 32
MKASPRWPVTSPPVTQHCMDAIRSLLTVDLTRRLGSAGLSTFTDHPFFSTLDFEALENKEIPPVFVPSSEKTNFDATYDLEELLLEEAPLEARTRRQKPRERLKDDATAKEIREDELHKTIEKLFEPFDYTTVVYDKLGSRGRKFVKWNANEGTGIPELSTAPQGPLGRRQIVFVHR